MLPMTILSTVCVAGKIPPRTPSSCNADDAPVHALTRKIIILNSFSLRRGGKRRNCGCRETCVQYNIQISKSTTRLQHPKRKFFKNDLGEGGWPTAAAKVEEGRGGYLGCKGAGHPGCRGRSFKDTLPHLKVIYDPTTAHSQADFGNTKNATEHNNNEKEVFRQASSLSRRRREGDRGSTDYPSHATFQADHAQSSYS